MQAPEVFINEKHGPVKANVGLQDLTLGPDPTLTPLELAVEWALILFLFEFRRYHRKASCWPSTH